MNYNAVCAQVNLTQHLVVFGAFSIQVTSGIRLSVGVHELGFLSMKFVNLLFSDSFELSFYDLRHFFSII